MTDQQPNERDQRDQQGRHGPGTAGAWQPVPGGGDYDPDQTMHVSFAAQLPPEPRPGEDPLGAHGPAGPGWSGHPDEEAGYLENGGYQVGQPLYGPGPDGGSAYDYRPQEQPGPHGGHSGRLPGNPERPYEHGGTGDTAAGRTSRPVLPVVLPVVLPAAGTAAGTATAVRPTAVRAPVASARAEPVARVASAVRAATTTRSPPGRSRS